MTEASRDPEVFLTQVNDAIEDVNSAIGEFVERSANLINSHLAEAGGILGTLVAGPLGGLVGGYLGHELEEQFEEGVDRINETWEVVSETIRQSIGGMLGDPLRMSSIASRYRECVDELGQVQQQIESADHYLAATWTGLAHTAYENTSRNQLEALHGMIESLEGAAQLLDDHQLARTVQPQDVQALSGEISRVGRPSVVLSGDDLDLIPEDFGVVDNPLLQMHRLQNAEVGQLTRRHRNTMRVCASDGVHQYVGLHGASVALSCDSAASNRTKVPLGRAIRLLLACARNSRATAPCSPQSSDATPACPRRCARRSAR